MKSYPILFVLIFISDFCFSQKTTSTAVDVLSTNSSPNQTTGIQIPCCPPPQAPNAISFSYDNAGNQIRRMFIYITPPLPRMAGTPAAPVKDEDLIPTDIYEEIKYYPNPVTSQLYLQWKEVDNKDLLSIDLYDLNGRLVRSFTNLSNQENTSIDFESYPAGYYNLMLLYKNGEPKTLKIVKL